MKHHHPRRYCVPLAVEFIIGEVIVDNDNDETNNNSITLKGNIMSVALVGKQRVTATLVPLDSTGAPIDLSIYPVDQVIQPGSVQGASSDLSLFTVTVDPTNQLTVVIESLGVGGTGQVTVIGRNAENSVISGTEEISVTEATTTTTTTEAPPTVPVAQSFQLNFGTPEDIS